MKRVAVITDATSPDFLFPVWQKYYGDLFGRENLFVVTYEGMKRTFPSDLGFVWELPGPYSDRIRAKAISSLVNAFLTSHDLVVRCDVDEFLIADPRRHESLRAYIEELTLPYVTARGVDVVEAHADAELDTKRALLPQRSLAIRASALSKTCIARCRIDWSEGFHAATVFPKFDDLFLLHMKFADIKSRIGWFEHMIHTGLPGGSSEAAYFSAGAQKLQAHQQWLLNRPIRPGWEALDSAAFDEQFLGSVGYNPLNGAYQGEFTVGDVLLELPREFASFV